MRSIMFYCALIFMAPSFIEYFRNATKIQSKRTANEILYANYFFFIFRFRYEYSYLFHLFYLRYLRQAVSFKFIDSKLLHLVFLKPFVKRLVYRQLIPLCSQQN